MAISKRKEVDILHLQRLQTLLDSPAGYGVRIQYLKIPMTIEEQLSWVANSDTQTAKALAENSRELLALRASIERMGVGQTAIARTLGLNVTTSAVTPDLISMSSFTKADKLPVISENISPSMILVFHRLTCFDLPSRAVGKFRQSDVWLGNMDGVKVEHIKPPAPSEVEPKLLELCQEWSSAFTSLRTKKAKLSAIAQFHAKLLAIHPFLDGNGRVARAVLMQQCVDFFGRADLSLLQKGTIYYQALRQADGGDIEALVNVITPVIDG